MGEWVDPDYLDMELKRRLWGHMPKSWEWSVKADVLYLVGDGLQTAKGFFEHGASAKRVAQLKRVQGKARELLQALAALTPEAGANINAHLVDLMLGTDAPERVSSFTEDARHKLEALEMWWDVVQDIEVSCAYAAAQESPQKSQRPAISNARLLAYFAARAVYIVLGKLPPRGKGTWFPEFALELGGGFNLKCGQALVNAVLCDMAEDPQYKNRVPQVAHERRHSSFTPPFPSPN